MDIAIFYSNETNHFLGSTNGKPFTVRDDPKTGGSFVSDYFTGKEVWVSNAFDVIFGMLLIDNYVDAQAVLDASPNYSFGHLIHSRVPGFF